MKKLDKLIELLNEYDSGWAYDDYYGPFQYGQDSDAYHLCKYQLVSKEYGFIKWLVESDKIDLDKLKDNTSFTMLTHSIGLGCEWHTAHEGESILRVIGTNAIIAYLSIQDEPIEFLISILK